MDLNWFNGSPPWLSIGRLRIRLWNIHHRRAVEGHWWGVGLLQIGNRHLCYVGDAGIYLLFLGRTP